MAGIGLRALLLTSLVATVAAASESVSIVWRAEVDYACHLPGNLPRISDPVGAPALPEEIVVLDVPCGKAFAGVTCTASWSVLTNGAAPSPVPPPERIGGAPARPVPDSSIYSRDVWPSTPVELLHAFTVAGQRRVSIRVRPCRWRGASWSATGRGAIEAASDLAFVATFTNAPSCVAPPLLQSVAPAPDLIILAPPDLRDAWEGYAAQRRLQRSDLSIGVVGTDAIYAAHTFGGDSPCRNAAESIHAFIREQAQAGVANFLLGGMWLDARTPNPDRCFRSGEPLSLSNCVPGVCVYPYTGTDGGEIPSDMFYACLDDPGNGIVHPWDPDGDGVYLSSGESGLCDRMPDVVVARFAALPYTYGGAPAESPAQLVTRYAAKVARGEGAAFGGAHRIGLASAQLVRSEPRGSTSFGRTRRDVSFFDDVPNVWSPEHPASVADAEYVVRDIFQSVVAPHWPVQFVESIHATGGLFARRYPSMTAARNAWFASELLYATCRSHGSVTSTAADGTAHLTRDQYANATGLALFTEFGVPCLTGSLTCSRTVNGRVCAEPSLGLAAVSSPLGGTVVGVFNAGYGWGATFESMALSDTYSGTLSYNLTRQLFEHPGATPAQAHLRARQGYASSYEMKGVRLYALCEQMFYGDPTVRLPSVETEATLSSDTTMTQNVSFVTVNVAADEDARLAGPGELRVMETLACAGTNLEVSAAGGVGRRVAFTGTLPGTLTLTDDTPFFVGGISNCASIAINGSRKTVDVSSVGSALMACTVNGTHAAEPNVLHCTTVGRLAGLAPITVRDASLSVETVETFGAGTVPLAIVTNGTLTFAASPLWGWSDATEHLARPISLSNACLSFGPNGMFFFGRPNGATFDSFELKVAGASRLEPVAAGAVVGLVGATTVRLEEGAQLDWRLPATNTMAGSLVFTGRGTVRLAAADTAAGTVEVASGVTLELAAAPLAAVTSLVVRTGATLRIPATESGWHQLVASGGRVAIESGAVVTDLAGRTLTGEVADAAFFEAQAALRWKGGAGRWSDPAGWFDAGTQTYGPWITGRTAVFNTGAPSVVTNDAANCSVAGFVFASDAALAGAAIRCAATCVTVPEGVAVELSAPLAQTNGLVKLGGGVLTLASAQSNLVGAVSADEGTLALKGVTAPGVTNLSAVAGTKLSLHGASELTNATARASLAANALVEPDAPASLAVKTFTPSGQMHIPAGVTVRTTGEPDLGGNRWTATIDGRVEHKGVLTLTYGITEGTGTVRVAGLLSRCYTSMAKMRGIRLELAPEEGVFPVWGKGIYSSHYGYFSFDGVTLAPCGGDVLLSGLGFAGSRAVMYIEEGGVTFDTSDGSLVLGEEGSDILFGGEGPVTKVGSGEVRFTADVVDQHEGGTDVRGGTYAVESWTLAEGFAVRGEGTTLELSTPECWSNIDLGEGTILDMSDPEPTWLATTNLTAAAGATIRMSVGPDDGDLIDVRGGALSLAGTVPCEVVVLPGARPGIHPFFVVDARAARRLSSLAVNLLAPSWMKAAVRRTSDGTILFVDIPRPGTVLLIR